MLDLSIIVENIDLFLQGLVTTAWLVSASLVLGLMLAVPSAIALASRNPALRLPVWAYVYFFRGTPLIVQTFMIYYGLPQMAFWRELTDAVPLLADAWPYALIAFTLNTGAYTAEILRGAIANTPFGEVEAARAMGMSEGRLYRRIVLPSAFRRALPAYGNEMVFMLHGSAIASTITIVDLLGAGRIINSRYFAPYEAYITAGLFYMALCYLIVIGVARLEKHLNRHLRPRDG